MNSQKTVNAAVTTPRKSKSRIASQVQDGGTGQGGTGRTLWDILGLRGVRESKRCSVFCRLSVCIDRAVFASIEDSDSDPDNHGEDSSSNASADDHMTTKRSQCCLQGAGVKEVRESVPTEMHVFTLVGLVVVPLERYSCKSLWPHPALLWLSTCHLHPSVQWSPPRSVLCQAVGALVYFRNCGLWFVVYTVVIVVSRLA